MNHFNDDDTTDSRSEAKRESREEAKRERMEANMEEERMKQYHKNISNESSN